MESGIETERYQRACESESPLPSLAIKANAPMAADTPPTQHPTALAFGLSLDPWGRLVLIDADGRRHVGVEPVRGFPLTDPNLWVSLCDAEGHEIVCIEDLSALPAATRQLLAEELAAREFVPIIKRIVKVSGESSPSEWQIETDRGPVHFTLDSEDDVRRLGPNRVLIADAKRMRYLIPDTRDLDVYSRRVLERYL